MRRLKICFVGPYAYPLLNPRSRGSYGGAEFRAAVFGKGLAKDPSNDVAFLVRDHGQAKVQEIDHIRVFRSSTYILYPRALDALKELVSLSNHFPYVGVRRWALRLIWALPLGFLIWTWLKARTALRRLFSRAVREQVGNHFSERFQDYVSIDADIYCTFGVSNLSSEISEFCKRQGRKFVLFLASEYDLSDIYHAGSQEKNIYGVPGALCYDSIMGADRIVAQTDIQANLLKSRFGRECLVIRNPIDLGPWTVLGRHDNVALWIGGADVNKRPKLFLDLAQHFPSTTFVMVLNRRKPSIFDEIQRALPKNVRLFEHVPLKESEQWFARAQIFVNTSQFEGFPNTFLQAGAHGVPVLSMKVDPDGFIADNECGLVAGEDFGLLVEGFRRLISDAKFYSLCSRNIRDYVETHHEAGARIEEVQRMLRSLVGSDPCGETGACPGQRDQHESASGLAPIAVGHGQRSGIT